MRQSKSGFSLIELMIVVAIIGILASVAYPSYVEHVKDAKRAEGQAALLGFAGAMERHFTLNGSYWNATATSNANVTTPESPKSSVFNLIVPLDGGTAYYDLQVELTKTDYTVWAKDIGTMEGDGDIYMKSNGERSW